MATYFGTTRTNYFSVTDPQKLAELVGKMSAKEKVQLFNDDRGKYGFGCCSSISGLADEGEDKDDACYEADYDLMCEELQGIVTDGDAIIIMEAGSEALRYVWATGTIITKDSTCVVSLRDCIIEKTREMLNDTSFTTETEY